MYARVHFVSLVLVLVMAVSTAGCTTSVGLDADEASAESYVSADGAHEAKGTQTTEKFENTFNTIAMCTDDIGYDIAFGGTRKGIMHTSVDAQGETHATVQFRVHDFTGYRVDNPSFTYDVIGGAEMLTWNTQNGQVVGVPAKSQHAGTLVFDPVGGGAKVVAHHAIRYVENGQGEVVVSYSDWKCTTRG